MAAIPILSGSSADHSIFLLPLTRYSLMNLGLVRGKEVKNKKGAKFSHLYGGAYTVGLFLRGYKTIHMGLFNKNN